MKNLDLPQLKRTQNLLQKEERKKKRLILRAEMEQRQKKLRKSSLS